MGKKKGKGKGQAQQPAGDQQKAEPSTSARSTSQESEPAKGQQEPGTSQQQKSRQKSRKGQQETPSQQGDASQQQQKGPKQKPEKPSQQQQKQEKPPQQQQQQQERPPQQQPQEKLPQQQQQQQQPLHPQPQQQQWHPQQQQQWLLQQQQQQQQQLHQQQQQHQQQPWRLQQPQGKQGLPQPGYPQQPVQPMQRGPLPLQQPQQQYAPQPYWGPPIQQGQPVQQFGMPYAGQPQQQQIGARGPQVQQGQQQMGPPPGLSPQIPPGFPQPQQTVQQPQQRQGPQQQQPRQGPHQRQSPQEQPQGPQQQPQGPQQQPQLQGQQLQQPQLQGPQQQQPQLQGPQQQQPQLQGPQQQQQQQPRPGPQQAWQGSQQQAWQSAQQQQPRQGPQQQQQQRQGPQQQQAASQQQQQRSPPQQQPQQQQPSQQQKRQTPRQDPQQRQQEQIPQQPKEQSPPFGGHGDCLKQLALVKPGTKGRKICVESNHLALNVGNLMNAIHYDVAITPDTPKSLLRDVMIIFGQKHYPNRHPAFDGRKNLYSPTKLPFGDTDSISDLIKVDGENRPKEFKVEIKFARLVDLSPLHDMLRTKTSPQDALQCLDIVLRNAPSNTCITAGRCFFTPPVGQIIQLGDGMEMYYGFYQSAIRGWKPLLNVDVAHKAFPSALEVLDLICELGSDYRYQMSRNDLSRPLTENLQKNLEKFIKTLKIKYEITGQSGSKRIYRVNGLGVPPSKAQFKMEDGKETTVDKYFQSVKRCKLRYPHLPTLWVGARERDSKILLPLEFCSIVEGQTVNRKMNENQTSAMIKKSATSTEIRKKKIMDSLNKAKYNNDPCIKEFGFSVSNQFERLDARVLTPPNLLYAGNNIVNPSKGVWRADRSKFLVGATIKKWTIACVTRQPCRVEQLADMIFKMAGSNGMQMVAKASPPFVHVGGRQTLYDITDYFKTKQDFDLIFVVVPNSGPQYSFVKQAAELNVGCLTQCIKERTLNKLNPQTAINILLKVNSKMNGTNHAFSQPCRPLIMSRPCMIMGADVTHPSPDARDIPSVAAVTASHDPKAFQYNICWRLQPPKVEIIEDLCNITIEQLKFFYQKTGHKPERIVFFRDGVSEGQFREVQRAEITAIQQACRKVQAEGYQPAITFLVVQKRHHTRLFPTNPKDSEDKNMNVPAGTCVDTLITNPTMQDFYLVSHASIQGVAKPTKYCTLWDDNKMSNDDIEELTYHLCHMFTRCNRSVSYPAPTYYAHLAAARAKVYIENDKLNMDELKKHQESYQIRECISKEKPMFFV